MPCPRWRGRLTVEPALERMYTRKELYLACEAKTMRPVRELPCGEEVPPDLAATVEATPATHHKGA